MDAAPDLAEEETFYDRIGGAPAFRRLIGEFFREVRKEPELADLYPELKHLRLRGRLEGRKLVPYYSREEWASQESKRSPEALLWIDDPIEAFFLHIQGSGRVVFEDGTAMYVNYAASNGHPYVPLGRVLIERHGPWSSRA